MKQCKDITALGKCAIEHEQKPTDKVEPKFKVKDWVLNDVCFPMQIASIRDGMYVFTKGDAISISFVDENYHLWTIADANAGDVLVDEDNNIGLYSGEKDDLYWHSCIYLGCDGYIRGGSRIGGYHKYNNTKPATEEQRVMLFHKMKEAGFEWDAEKKELKKIELKILDIWKAE